MDLESQKSDSELSKRNPHDIIGIPGIIRAHKRDIENEKLRIRMENERYLHQHPEINAMIQLFMKNVLDYHPVNILEFAGKFFDQPNLKYFIEEYGQDWVQPGETENNENNTNTVKKAVTNKAAANVQQSNNQPILAVKIKEINPLDKERPRVVEEVIEAFRHIRLRWQAAKVSQQDVPQCLLGDDYSNRKILASELDNVLLKEPFGVKFPADRSRLVRWLMKGGQEAQGIVIVDELMKQLPKWDVFSEEQENQYGDEIIQTFSEHLERFQTAWADAHQTGSGTISYAEYTSILDSLEIQFTAEISQYLILLFYTISKELDTVPYAWLVSQCQGNDDFNTSPETQKQIISEVFYSIAEALFETEQTIQEVFKASGTLLWQQDFENGLGQLGLEVDEGPVEIFIGWLQSEMIEDRPCIEFPRFEEILTEYLQSIQQDETRTNTEEPKLK